MPYTDPNALDALLHHPGDFLLLGVGMVAGKIKSDPVWQMGAMAFVIALIVPSVTLVSAVDGHVDKEVKKQVAPLQVQLNNVSNDTTEIKQLLRDMKIDNKAAIEDIKESNSAEHTEIKNRLQWLERRETPK